jgi:hypothetical protein
LSASFGRKKAKKENYYNIPIKRVKSLNMENPEPELYGKSDFKIYCIYNRGLFLLLVICCKTVEKIAVRKHTKNAQNENNKTN